MLIHWPNQQGPPLVDRLLWLDPTGTDAVVIRLGDRKAMPRWLKCEAMKAALVAGEARELEEDPYKDLWRAEKDIKPKHRERRDSAWEKIASLVTGADCERIFFSKARGSLVKAASAQHKISVVTLYFYLRRYWQGGQIVNALLPLFENCGGKGNLRRSGRKKRGRKNNITKRSNKRVGVNVTGSVLKRFKLGYQKFYNNSDGLSLADAFEETINQFFNKGYKKVDGEYVPILPPADKLPTYQQFRYWYKRTCEPKKAVIARAGIENYNKIYRPPTGDATHGVFGPTHEYQIDATVGDIYLLSSFFPDRIIGRPIIYLVVDVASRMIVGLHVGLEGPSWEGAMAALYNAMTDKVTFCQEYGITIAEADWPCHFIPESVTGDWSEMASFDSNNLVPLGMRVDNPGVGRPDWKPFVERDFRTVDERGVKWLPGSMNKFKKRRAKGYELDATLNLHDFTRTLIYTVRDHNNGNFLETYQRDVQQIRDRVDPFPIDLWNHGIERKVGRPIIKPAELIRRTLLYRDRASVTDRGIFFHGIRYRCEYAQERDWYFKAGHSGAFSVEVSHHRLTVNSIYLVLENGKRMEECTLHESEERFRDMSLYDVLDLRALEDQDAYKHRTRQRDSRALLHAHKDSIVSEARKRKAQALAGNKLSKTARKQSIGTNRKDEKMMRRELAHRVMEKPPQSETGVVIPFTQKQQPVDAEYIPPANPARRLRAHLNRGNEDE